MSSVSVATFLAMVEQIRQEKPVYKLGRDGSDGFCDCIGLVRGALTRAGIKTSGLSGTNQAARSGAIRNLHQITKGAALAPGQVVLKTRDPNDGDYPLPDKYRQGGAAYNGDLTNYTHIGVVTQASPLRITHMTSPEPAVDTKIGKWCYAGDLRYIDGSEDTGGTVMQATTHADNGKPINFRKQPGGALLDKIPVGTEVELISGGDEWSQVVYKGRVGYVMTAYLVMGGAAANQDDEAADGDQTVTVTIPRAMADAIVQLLGDLVAAVNGRG